MRSDSILSSDHSYAFQTTKKLIKYVYIFQVNSHAMRRNRRLYKPLDEKRVKSEIKISQLIV